MMDFTIVSYHTPCHIEGRKNAANASGKSQGSRCSVCTTRSKNSFKELNLHE